MRLLATPLSRLRRLTGAALLAALAWFLPGPAPGAAPPRASDGTPATAQAQPGEAPDAVAMSVRHARERIAGHKLAYRYGIAKHGDGVQTCDVFEADRPTTATGTGRAILLIHGGGWNGGTPTAYYKDAAYYRDRGYTAIVASYRLVKPDRNKWPTQLEDLRHTLRFVRSIAPVEGFDPDRIGVVGSSAGGHLTTALTLTQDDIVTTAGSVQPARIVAAVNMCGPVDFTAPFPRTNSLNYDVQALVDGLLNYSALENPERARRDSPLSWVHQGAPPFLIAHGTEDPLVPLDQSTKLAQALTAVGVEVKLLVYEGQGHMFKPPVYPQYRDETLAFFRSHVGWPWVGEAPAGAAKPARGKGNFGGKLHD